MVSINGNRYITLKTYAELNGISLSRVSQLKPTLPVDHIEDLNLDLINYDLVELKDEVRRAAETEFANRESLTTYTLVQLGEFFQGLISRLIKQGDQATQLHQQAETALRQLRQQKADQEEQARVRYSELEQSLGVAEVEMATLSLTISDLQQQLDRASQYQGQLQQQQQDELATLRIENQGLKLAMQTLEGVLERHTAVVPSAVAAPATNRKRKENA